MFHLFFQFDSFRGSPFVRCFNSSDTCDDIKLEVFVLLGVVGAKERLGSSVGICASHAGWTRWWLES